jgi:Flp pilus assembly secretin CpaC
MPHDFSRPKFIGGQRTRCPATRRTAWLVTAFVLAASASAPMRGAEPAKPTETKPADSLPPPINAAVQVTIEASFYEVSQSDFAALDFSQYGMKVSAPASAAAGTMDQALTPILRVGTFDVSAAIKKIPSVELLSSPGVTTLSGKPAKITVGEEMQFPNPMRGGTDGQPQVIPPGKPEDFTKGFVGVELEATATVAADGKTIALSVKPTTTKFEGFVEYGGPSIAYASGSSLTAPSGFFQPVFNVRSTHVDVTLQDGATLTVGFSSEQNHRNLESLDPLIGRLFQSKGEGKEKRALLVFITVIIHKPGATVRPATKFVSPASVSP